MVEITFIPMYADSYKTSLKNSSIPQSFSIPPNIIYYIANNYLLLKLLKTCKYFYLNARMVINTKSTESGNGVFYEFIQLDSKTLQLRSKYPFNHLQTTTFLKLFREFHVGSNYYKAPYIASSILEKTYSCDITHLTLPSSQDISYDEYLFLTSSRNITHFYNFESTIKYKNGEIVTLEKLLEPLPNLNYLLTTMPKVNEPRLSLKVAHALNFTKLKACAFFSFAFDEFNITEFLSFFRKSEHQPTFFIFSFDGASVNLEIDIFVDELLASWTIEDVPLPAISCYGMKKEKSEAMRLKRIEFKNRNGISFDTSQFDFIYITNVFNHDLANLSRKIYRCDARSLIAENQNLTFNEFSIFSSTGNIEFLNLCHVTIIKASGTIMAPEEIFQLFPKISEFQFSHTESSLYTRDTVNLIMKCPNFKHLHLLSLRNISEAFDFKCFSEYMKTQTITEINLFFSETISPTYAQEIQKFVDYTLECSIKDYFFPPKISFPGYSEEQFKAVYELRFQFYEKRRRQQKKIKSNRMK